MQVPCVAVVENMSYFDADGKRYFPFGKGSGAQALRGLGLGAWDRQLAWGRRTRRATPGPQLHRQQPAPPSLGPAVVLPLPCLGPIIEPLPPASGERIQHEFGLPNLVRFPIVPELSAAGDGGRPVVVQDPAGPTSQAFLELGAAVVREVRARAGGMGTDAAGGGVGCLAVCYR